ncbi:MAG: hypothetical protein GC181_04380 [Bacteroidetes bacterium]|nr:hypothetical protein [Bacteroidota bacterium]
MKITTTCAAMLLLCTFLAKGQTSQFTDSIFTNVFQAEQLEQPGYAIINVVNEGVDASGATDVDQLISDLLNQKASEGLILYFPAGVYQFNSTIKIPSNVWLIGDGSGKTFLKLNCGENEDGISMCGKTKGKWTELTNENLTGSDKIVCSPENLNPGDLIRIKIQDENLITSDWASGCVGQIVKIKEVLSDGVRLEKPLRINAGPSNGASFIHINKVSNSGLFNMSIERTVETQSQTSNILLKYTDNCFVYGVESLNSNYAHINMCFSYGNVVYGNFLKDAFAYGDGGQGYGVVFSHTSSDCIAENNVFDHLRHSILFQAGPNGNIASYNYSTNPYWTSAYFPDNFSGDIVFHGNYPFGNLVEGNVCQNIVIDNSHGINGPNNIFLRNRAETAGIFMNDEPASNGQVFWANEVTGNGNIHKSYFTYPLGNYVLAGTGHDEKGNLIKGVITPSGTSVDVISLYLKEKPGFMSGFNFPAVGNEQEFNRNTIPSQHRFGSTHKTIDFPFKNPYSVRIINFNLNQKEESVQLNWQVSNPEVCRNFEIYRSVNGSIPSFISSINCNSNTPNLYQYEDLNSLNSISQVKTIAYHIIMKIEDESVSSDTITLEIEKITTSVYMNNERQLQVLGSPAQVNLYDQTGHLCQSLMNPTGSDYTVSPNLLDGIYYVQVLDEKGNGGFHKLLITSRK